MRGRPAERGRPRAHAVVDLAAQQRVDDEGLDAGVPGAARLGGLGVDLGGGERDLAAVAQDGLAQHRFLARVGELVDVLLDDVDRERGPGRRSAEGDRPDQLAGAVPKTSAVMVEPLVGVAEPLDERGDAGLGDQARPRTARSGGRLRYQGSCSSIRWIAAVDERPDRALEPADGRRAASGHASIVRVTGT